MPGDHGRDFTLQATVDAIRGARRTLVAITSLSALGYFHLFHWYGSWQLARISAWTAIAEHRRALVLDAHRPAAGRVPRTAAAPGPAQVLPDTALRLGVGEGVRPFAAESTVLAQYAQANARVEALSREWADRQYEVPLLGLTVPGSDYSVAIIMVAMAMLVWLLLSQRRLNACLGSLEQEAGWGEAKRVLQLHFALLGRHATRTTRVAAFALIAALPLLAFLSLLGDGYDLYGYWTSQVYQAAFSSDEFVRRVTARLVLDAVLCLATGFVGGQCLKEYTKAQADLLRFAATERPTNRSSL